MAGIMIGLVLFLTLIYWKIVFYQNFQILGVAFTPEHAESKEVQRLQDLFKRKQLLTSIVFVILTLVFQLDFFDGMRDTLQLIALFVYIIVSYLPFQSLQQQLIELKHDKGWIYAEGKRQADLRVSREKGKGAPHSVWIWLIWLASWFPLGLAFFSGAPFEVYLPLLIINVVFVILPLSYNRAIRQKPAVIFEDSEMTLAYTRRYERLQGMGYLMITIVLTVFLIVLSWFTLRGASGLAFLLLLLVFLLVLVGIIFYILQKNQALQTDFFEGAPAYINERSGRYKWGFYYNPDDYRLFVPKQASGMGVTINIARPAGKLMMGLTALFLAGVVVMALVMSTATFDVTIEEEGIAIEAPLYNSQISVEEIERVELTQTSLKGMRTNGYGGAEKAYGYFTLDEYGPVKLYAYPNNTYHIDILLNENHKPRWIILNEPTREETEELFQKIQNRMRE